MGHKGDHMRSHGKYHMTDKYLKRSKEKENGGSICNRTAAHFRELMALDGQEGTVLLSMDSKDYTRRLLDLPEAYWTFREMEATHLTRVINGEVAAYSTRLTQASRERCIDAVCRSKCFSTDDGWSGINIPTALACDAPGIKLPKERFAQFDIEPTPSLPYA